MPEGRGFPGLDKSQLGLMPARVETFCGLVFVNLDPDAQPLGEQLAGLEQKLAPYGIERLTRFSESTSAQPANWKIVADNYLEGYHVPIAHPGLMRLLDYQRYDVEVGDGYVFFEAPLREKPSGNRLERAYQRLVPPDAGAQRGRHPRLALHLHLPEHNNRPVSRSGHHVADQPARARRHRTTSMRATAPTQPSAGDARGPAPQPPPQQRGGRRRTPTSSPASRPGWRRRGWRPGPLGEREAAVAWFADRVRRDLEAAGVTAPRAGRPGTRASASWTLPAT